MMKALYSYKQQKNKTFFYKKTHSFLACLHFPVTENREPLRIEHSHWLNTKKGFSHQPIRILVLWDFPTYVTGNCRSAREA